MTDLEKFLWGVIGSAAAETVAIFLMMAGSRKLPARYHRPAFWVVRAFLASIAGALAVAYGVDSRLLAFHIGAATPLIIQALAEKVDSFVAGSTGRSSKQNRSKKSRRKKLQKHRPVDPQREPQSRQRGTKPATKTLEKQIRG